jgi:feruloyl esterase
VNWVEKGIAPQSILAARTAPAGGPQAANATQAPAMTRPLCPYPAVARYKGTGSTDDAASFSCVAPAK